MADSVTKLGEFSPGLVSENFGSSVSASPNTLSIKQ